MAETKILYKKEVKTIIDVHLIYIHIRHDIAVKENSIFSPQKVAADSTAYGCKLYYINIQTSPTIDSFNAFQLSYPVFI